MNLTGKKEYFEKFYTPFGVLLYKLHFPANFVTLLSLLVGTASALAYKSENLLLGMSLLIISGILDLSDGVVARLSGKPTKFGAIFDWVTDKWIDGVILGTVGYFYAGPFWAILVVNTSMLHSFIKPVVYAEIGYLVKIKGKIRDPLENIGFFGRPETYIFLVIFTILEKFNTQIGLNYGIKLIALLTLFSLFQRIGYLYKNFAKSYDE